MDIRHLTFAARIASQCLPTDSMKGGMPRRLHSVCFPEGIHLEMVYQQLLQMSTACDTRHLSQTRSSKLPIHERLK